MRGVLSSCGVGLAIAVLGVVVPVVGQGKGAIAQTLPTVTEAQKSPQQLMELGKQLEETSQYEAALKAEEQALAIYRRIQDRNGEAEALNGLGIIYRSLSPYDKALDYS